MSAFMGIAAGKPNYIMLWPSTWLIMGIIKLYRAPTENLNN